MHLKQALHTRKNITAESLIELFNKIDTKFYPMDLTSTPVSWYIGLEH